MKILLLCSLFCGFLISYGQNTTALTKKNPTTANRYTSLAEKQIYPLDISILKNTVIVNQSIKLPNLKGAFEIFVLTNSNTLSPALQQQFPSILSYRGYSTTDSKKKIRLDFNEKGLFAWIKTPNESYYIHSLENKNQVVLFEESVYKKAINQNFIELNPRKTTETTSSVARKSRLVKKPNAGNLRIYRLAVSCTGEYAQYYGGTKSLALAAIVSSINRVNEVFENDLSIRLELISGMESILFTDPTTDPYTDDDSNQLINQVQTEINNRIGKDNYDVGHVFSTGGGGVAQLGSVCGFYKGSGVTGSANPIGDPYDIDYVAHELGHQFGAEHTFNSEKGSCDDSRWQYSAYEPGSGTTIMGYAGICSPDNTQEQSDAYFHAQSIDEIVTYINSKGSTCGTLIQVENTPPQITVVADTFTIPLSTPFKLKGNAIDNEDTFLTYCWEEVDLGPSGTPTAPYDNAPIFRSFSPTISPIRYFPQLNDVVNAESIFGELLPNYARDLTFKLTVRDNHPNAGGVNDAKVNLHVSDVAGPFVVTSQSSPENYEVNQLVDVVWEVANTTFSPINCTAVTIWLSTDGGYTYPTLLLDNVPNNGNATIAIPNQLTTHGRLMVEAADNVFFNINAHDFTIVKPSQPGFSVSVSPTKQDICPPDSFQYTISLSRFAGFEEAVEFSVENEPTGLSVFFIEDTLTTDSITQLIIKPTANHLPGNYTLHVVATSSASTHSQSIQLRTHVANQPNTVELTAPANKDKNISLRPDFSWEIGADADVYSVEISTDSSFAEKSIYKNIVGNEWRFKETLAAETVYFWRVKAINTCGESDYSEINRFSTVGSVCESYQNITSLPLPNGTSLFSSPIEIPSSGLITDVNVKSIKGTHAFVSDLLMYLESPSGKQVKLLYDVCNGADGENFNIGFDDISTFGQPNCPPTSGLVRVPLEPLSAFIGEEAKGTWRLYIRDDFEDFDDGKLLSWELELCSGQLLDGIAEDINSPIEVYPNPATNQVTFFGVNDLQSVRVYDRFGQLLVASISNQLTIEQLQSGVYFYVIQTNGKEIRGKFIKL